MLFEGGKKKKSKDWELLLVNTNASKCNPLQIRNVWLL